MGDEPKPCGAPGPDWRTCAGRSGHPGPHGSGALRWDDEAAERAAAEPEADEQPAGQRGVVTTPGGVQWRGVLTMSDLGVHVELVPAGPDVAAAFLPWHSVAVVELA